MCIKNAPPPQHLYSTSPHGQEKLQPIRTRTQHESHPKRSQQDRVPSLHVRVIRQTDPLLQRIGQHGYDQVLQQDVGEDGHADDEDGEGVRGAEGVEAHLREANSCFVLFGLGDDALGLEDGRKKYWGVNVRKFS